MTNPYSPTRSSPDAAASGHADTKTTATFWSGLVCGAISWVSAGLTFRYALESLYVGPPPSYAYAVMPATLLFGVAACVLLTYGYRRRISHPDHRWSPARFVIAGVAAGAPTALFVFTMLDSIAVL